jgi:hypothetical protein
MTQATTRVHGFKIAFVQLKVLASQAAVSLENTAALDFRSFRDFGYCSGDA